MKDAETATATASAPTQAAATTAPASEIKVMAHYVGADRMTHIMLPERICERAWRFTQPNSIIIPLDGVSGGTLAGANHSSSRQLSNLFHQLPPVAVAPIVRIPAASSTPASSSASLPAISSLHFNPLEPCVVAYQYGAIVFFNVPDQVQQEWLAKAQSGIDMAKLKDDYKVVLPSTSTSPSASSSSIHPPTGGASAPSSPSRPSPRSFACRFLTDSVELSSMDLNSVRIISQILSQAVAMQHYEGEAERLLIKLRAMMRPSELQNKVTTLDHQKSDLIVKYVAESSTAMVDVLTELKLLDRSEIVWGQGEYDALWTGLRREFDLSDRFDILQTKLDLLRDSHPFFLQVIHTHQSHRMEIIIIALIAVEVVLGLFELYVLGAGGH